MSDIVYTFSRIEAKEEVITDQECEIGNICSLVVGMTAISGDHSAYIDGVTGHMNYDKATFSGVIGAIANEFASGQNFKDSLRNQIIAQTQSPTQASGFTPPPINVN
jgi:hypothetical protein|uniref:hypothetical protein n=1 Tax=Flavobacterium sp. TaxID=239 RepID=UPI0040488E88